MTSPHNAKAPMNALPATPAERVDLMFLTIGYPKGLPDGMRAHVTGTTGSTFSVALGGFKVELHDEGPLLYFETDDEITLILSEDDMGGVAWYYYQTTDDECTPYSCAVTLIQRTLH